MFFSFALNEGKCFRIQFCPSFQVCQIDPESLILPPTISPHAPEKDEREQNQPKGEDEAPSASGGGIVLLFERRMRMRRRKRRVSHHNFASASFGTKKMNTFMTFDLLFFSCFVLSWMACFLISLFLCFLRSWDRSMHSRGHSLSYFQFR